MSKKLISALLLAMLAVGMTGCGDGDETITELNNINESLEALTLEPEVVLSEEEQAFRDYELRLSQGEFTAEDYLAFSDMCKEMGLIRRQRDLLEQSYRLFDDQTAFERLQTISVNLEEDASEILAEAELLLQNLELEEYVPEAINQVANAAWFETMMPKLYEGKRSYFLLSEGQIELMIEVGYTEEGEQFSKVWYVTADKQVKVLQKQGAVLRYMETTLGDNGYEGAFTAWVMDASRGDIQKESGTLAGGNYVGEYVVEVHTGNAASDLFSLWSNREGMEYTKYTGNFDENGKTTLEQPKEAIAQKLIKGSDYVDCLVYAYDEDKKNCLFTGLADGEDKDAYAYSVMTFGWDAYPTVTTYEVVKAENDGETTGTEENTVTLRIYDGEIQWYDGEKWISAGSVASYQKDDPFNTYVENAKPKTETVTTNEGSDGDGESIDRPSGSVEEEVTKPATTTKPTTTTTTKPTTTVTKPTTTTTTTTPTPTPTPDEDDDDDDDDDEQTSTPDSGSSDTGSDSGDDTSAGTDSDGEYGDWFD